MQNAHVLLLSEQDSAAGSGAFKSNFLSNGAMRLQILHTVHKQVRVKVLVKVLVECWEQKMIHIKVTTCTVVLVKTHG